MRVPESVTKDGYTFHFLGGYISSDLLPTNIDFAFSCVRFNGMMSPSKPHLNCNAGERVVFIEAVPRVHPDRANECQIILTSKVEGAIVLMPLFSMKNSCGGIVSDDALNNAIQGLRLFDFIGEYIVE